MKTNLFNFSKSPVLNLFRNKKFYNVKPIQLSPEELDCLKTMELVKVSWDNKQQEDPSISDEYKKFQIVSKVIKVWPKADKSRIHLVYDLLELGLIK
jgi:hypothetical protein